jgi:hypothetical protein
MFGLTVKCATWVLLLTTGMCCAEIQKPYRYVEMKNI